MTATAVIQTDGAKNVLFVPNAALRFIAPADAVVSETSGLQFRPPRADSSTPVTKERRIGEGSQQRLHVLERGGELRVINVRTGRSNGTVTAVAAPELKAGMTVVIGQKARTDL